MSRIVSIGDIIQRARQHADQRDKNFFSDQECINFLNEGIPDLYDLLVSIDDNYYTKEYDISISNATQDYDLPSDFYKSIGLDFQSVPGNEKITLYQYNEAERNISFTQNGNIPTGTVILRYVPVAPTFTSVNDTFDGVSGWDRLLSLRLATDMMDAEEANTDRIMKKYEQTLEHIMTALQRDIGMPATVTDITRPSVQYLYSTLKYRFYGNKVRFVSTEFLGDSVFAGPFV